MPPHDSPRLGGNIDHSFALMNFLSIPNKFGQVKDFAAFYKPDIIFITKSWLNVDTHSSVTFLGGY